MKKSEKNVVVYKRKNIFLIATPQIYLVTSSLVGWESLIYSTKFMGLPTELSSSRVVEFMVHLSDSTVYMGTEL